MQRTGPTGRLTGMNSSPKYLPANLCRRAVSFAGACGALVVLAVLAACSSATGTPTIASGSTTAPTVASSMPHPTPVSGPSSADPSTPVSTDSTPTGPATSIPVTVGTARPVPADCDTTSVPKAVPKTPSGAPIISVTAGANAWIAHRDTEPIRLALYGDGTVITTKGFGSISEPLPTATVGTVAPCLRDWAVEEFGDIMGLDMGESGVTDQGTTVVTWAPTGKAARALPIYALGIGDDSLPEPAQRANRVRLQTAITNLTTSVANRTPWTPDRLRLILTTNGKNIPGHRWPGPKTLSTLLADKTEKGCVEVTGETAGRVIKEIGSEPILAMWSDAGGETVAGGTFYLGILLPGQKACEA